MPANFKTYESQARLLAAVVAAHPDLKLNYKAISKYYGSSQTPSAIEHRFRPLRAAAQVLRDLVEEDLDTEVIEDVFDKKAIAEHFGESTADGIQFQFRGVKATAEILKAKVASGGDPATALPTTKATAKSAAATAPTKTTPRKRKAASTASTPSGNTGASMAQAVQVGAGSNTKPVRRSAAKNVRYKEESSTSNEEDSPLDYDALDSDSPSQFVKKVKTTPLKNPGPAQQITWVQRGAGRGGQSDTVVIDATTSPSESSIQTPGASGNDEVTFLKQEIVNTNSAVNSFPPFGQQPSFSQSSSQGNSFHVSNPGSFSQQPNSLFGGPPHAPVPHPQYQHDVAPGNTVQDPRSAKIAEAAANLRDVFGGRTVDWTMSNQDIFNSTYYDDNDNGDI